jgi:hypothetical protein
VERDPLGLSNALPRLAWFEDNRKRFQRDTCRFTIGLAVTHVPLIDHTVGDPPVGYSWLLTVRDGLTACGMCCPPVALARVQTALADVMKT